MKDLSAIEDVRLPDSDNDEVRIGDLWKDQPLVLVWLRHYGWTFCREYVTQLRGDYDEFRDRGAEIAAIGMGRPDMAAYFRDQFEIPFRLLVDQQQATYRAVEIRRGNQWEVAGPQVWLRYAKGLLTGKGVALPKQDVLQMGGAAVVDTEGKVLFMHRAETSADNAPVEKLLDALPVSK